MTVAVKADSGVAVFSRGSEDKASSQTIPVPTRGFRERCQLLERDLIQSMLLFIGTLNFYVVATVAMQWG